MLSRHKPVNLQREELVSITLSVNEPSYSYLVRRLPIVQNIGGGCHNVMSVKGAYACW